MGNAFKCWISNKRYAVSGTTSVDISRHQSTSKKSLTAYRLLLTLPIVLFFAGCASQGVDAGRALGRFRNGDDEAALKWAKATRDSTFSQKLGLLEMGRLKMLTGQFDESITEFETLIDKVMIQGEAGPVFSVGDFGMDILAGTIADDRARDYTVSAFEFILALQYQMLNRLFMERRAEAMVEMRRAVFAQDQIAEKYGAEVEAGRLRAAEQQGDSLATVNEHMVDMDAVVNLTRSTFENPVTWYLCGLLLEEDRDVANAAVALEKAWQLAPQNPAIRNDFLRLLRTQNPARSRDLMATLKINDVSPRPASGIVLIYEENLISRKASVKIPLILLGTVSSIDFPIYRDPAYIPSTIEVHGAGTRLGTMDSTLSIQSLAYRDLKERMPGIVLRNVTRVISRITTQAVAHNAARGSSNSGLLHLGVIAASAVQTVLTEADTRAWYTLPMNVQVLRSALPAGEHTLLLKNLGNGINMELPILLAEGETRIVWVADIAGRAWGTSATLHGRGAPTSFTMLPGILTAPTMIPNTERTQEGEQTEKQDGEQKDTPQDERKNDDGITS